MSKRIQDIQSFLKDILTFHIKPGDRVVDLTAGRGRDTLFLAEKVGDGGKVHAFDIQEEALKATKELLVANQIEERVNLYLLDHANLLEVIHEPIQVAMLNLGYLPGSNKEIVTNADSTRKALEAITSILSPGGLIALTIYRGHLGGVEEAQTVDTYLQTLPPKTFSVLRGEYTNQDTRAPFWILVQRNKGETK